LFPRFLQTIMACDTKMNQLFPVWLAAGIAAEIIYN